MKKITKIFIAIAIGSIISFMGLSSRASATSGSVFSVSPMNQRINLTPGETYHGTFKVTNPAKSTVTLNYVLEVTPMTVDDENYTLSFDNNGDYNQIVNWVVLDKTYGTIEPNQTEEVQFSIVVPENTPAGGQYCAIAVTSIPSEATEEGVNLQDRIRISHLLYTEVAGETVRKGNIDEANVASFLLSGNITGTSRISNTGNVHSDAHYTLQIFPLFSGEEIYTNEEDPEKAIIFPSTTKFSSLEWKETPSVGIFHVIYKVNFEGVESKVDKMVIVCPLWLLFLIILAIFLIIFKIWSSKKNREKK